MSTPRRVLVVEDGAGIGGLLMTSLARSAPAIDAARATNLAGARAALDREAFPLVFIEARLPDGSGLDLVRELRRTRPDARLVVFTAEDAMTTAIEAMTLGAYDCLQKPIDADAVQALAEEVFRQLEGATSDAPPAAPAEGPIGRGAAMLEVAKAVRELEGAVQRCMVLAQGEPIERAEPALADEAAPDAEDQSRLRAVLRAMVASAGPTGNLHRGLIERLERELFELALERTGGNQLRAAALLGINRNTLSKKLSALGLRARLR
jgi:DNA-binding NtrC family response regulator